MSGYGGTAYSNQAGSPGNAAGAGMLAQAATGKRDFLYCIPMAIGPPTLHAISMKPWMVRVLVIQVIACILRVAILQDYFGGLWMGLVIALGAHGYWESMNITYICCWGVLCTINMFLDVISSIIPALLSLVTFDFLDIVVRALLPLAYAFGSFLAYHLYLDYAETNAMETGWMTKLVPDVFMMFKSKVDTKMPFLEPSSPTNQQEASRSMGPMPQQQPYNVQIPPQQPNNVQQPPGAVDPGAAGSGSVENWLQGVGASLGSAFGAAAAQGATTQAQNQYGLAKNQAQQYANQGAAYGQQYANQGAAYGQQAVNQGTAYGQQAVNSGSAYGQQAVNQGQAYGQAAVNQAQYYGSQGQQPPSTAPPNSSGSGWGLKW